MITSNLYEELVKFRDGPVYRAEGPTPIINELVSQKLIEVIENEYLGDFTIRPVCWAITVKGESALLEYEQSLEQKAKAEAQQNFQNKISVASVLVPAVTFILGLVIENRTGIVRIFLEMVG